MKPIQTGHFLPTTCSILLATACSHAAVLIDKTVNNGDFTTTTLNTEITSLPGWTVVGSGTFVAANYDSSRSDGPFGAPSGGSSLFLHNNGGTILRSNSTIELTNGDSLKLAYDYSTPTTPATLSFDLYQSGVLISTLYATSTGSVIPGFQLNETTVSFSGVTGNYNLAIKYSPGAASSDVAFDRLYLATVPEPSSSLLLGGGVAVALLRRKRRSA